MANRCIILNGVKRVCHDFIGSLKKLENSTESPLKKVLRMDSGKGAVRNGIG